MKNFKYLEIDEDVNEISDFKGEFKRSMVYGVGIDDVAGSKEWNSNGKRESYKYYSVWRNMLRRCYHSRGDYKGIVSVREDWFLLSNFKTWFDDNYIDGYELDKDILGGNVYSSDTCIFIPRELNVFLTSIRKKCGSYYDKDRKKFQSYTNKFKGGRKNIGRFNTHEEAVFYAKTFKMMEIIKLMATLDLDTKIVVGLHNLLDDVYFSFILPKIKQVGNCTFLDTGGVFKGVGNSYDLSIIKLSDYV